MVYKRVTIKKHGKWEKYTVELSILVSCPKKHKKWETHTVEHPYEWVALNNIENEKHTL
jgi:hypothetical protein